MMMVSDSSPPASTISMTKNQNDQQSESSKMTNSLPGHKKRRRGKRQRAQPYSFTHSMCKSHDLVESSPDNHVIDCARSGLDINSNSKEGVKKNERRGRHQYSPRAPENYTQFLIGDQLEQLSVTEGTDSSNFSETVSDFDFLTTQFESDFKHARAIELDKKSKNELAELVYALENKKSILIDLQSQCVFCHSDKTVSKIDSSSTTESYNGVDDSHRKDGREFKQPEGESDIASIDGSSDDCSSISNSDMFLVDQDTDSLRRLCLKLQHQNAKLANRNRELMESLERSVDLA